MAEPFNTRPRYVASMALEGPLEWENSTLLEGDLSEAVAALKSEYDGDLHVLGSTRVVQALHQHGLIDEFRLMVDPIVIGVGKASLPRRRRAEAAATRRRRGDRERRDLGNLRARPGLAHDAIPHVRRIRQVDDFDDVELGLRAVEVLEHPHARLE
jgi:dihydrofolate reductase